MPGELYGIYVRTILDSINKTYKNVVIINTEPEGALKNMTTRIRNEKLSEFQEYASGERLRDPCIYVILNPRNPSQYAEPEDLPEVFSFILQNGYMIDTMITNMMQHNDDVKPVPAASNQSFVCFVRQT